MKNLIIILALMFAIPAFATGKNGEDHNKHHQHEQHHPSKPDIPSPRTPTASKATTNAPEAKTNTEGSRDACERWIKPTYCYVKP